MIILHRFEIFQAISFHFPLCHISCHNLRQRKRGVELDNRFSTKEKFEPQKTMLETVLPS